MRIHTRLRVSICFLCYEGIHVCFVISCASTLWHKSIYKQIDGMSKG